MSADSPRRNAHKGAQVVSPQPIVDRSIIDSVAGIINDIVPQAYTAAPGSDNKESITWARFEYADVNDSALYPDYNEGSSTPPLLLVLGYTTGVQVWLIAATGEATEVLSWRQGVVRTLRILLNPKTDNEHVDPFESKRPLVAICDSAGPGPQFCNVSFISLKTGEQTKNIKFKNPVCDILANRRSVVVTFLEKIAVFDARTLEDILTVTTCYPSPGPNPNPVALGTRWLAYNEKKLLPARRSSGGCEGEGVQSYTATVLYAAKSLGKGLRGLGETVASSLTGNSVSPVAMNNMGNDITQPGVVMILDLQAAKEEKDLDDANIETVIAHFTAHSDAIVAMTFDLTGALLMTADRRGHDFHVFRIQPHPGGPTLAAVHHLYILHRGDTTAKVQDMTFSADTRWAAVSTVRGTTHVFPVAPYGGPVGVRTHSTPHVVNRLSRFHRSAGLTDDGTRSHSPVSHTELPLSVYPYSNPRLPPYPHPTILHPLAQIRQPSTLNHVNSQTQPRPQQRQRLHSDDSGTLPLKICACFAPPRAWIYAQRESNSKVVKRAVDSLFIMACHGNMIQYDLEPKPAAGVPKEKVCDDTMIELEVEAKGQWPLLRSPNSAELIPPLPPSSPLLSVSVTPNNVQPLDTSEDRWLSQVEIVTHAGPHRRLWMGPQFVFKTYNAPSGVAVNLVEAEAIEIGVTGGSRPARSNPVNMPHAASRPLVPVVIDGSGSSYEQSPRFMEAYGDPLDGDNMGVGSGENQLREDLAEAMLETSIAPNRAPGRRSVFERVGQPVTKVVNPLGTVITVSADEEDVHSGQEFDSAEESLAAEAPRSVCAEEGPASLASTDLEPDDSKTLRDLTEICAEMRTASEPATIDSVPDDSIQEVRERKELCVEIAPNPVPVAACIDFEREDAFRDVPSGLSLCAEQGEVAGAEVNRKTAANRAKYVVNYDEDSVTLLENRAASSYKEVERPKARKQNSVHKEAANSTTTTTTTSTTTTTTTRVNRYVLKEQDDSVVIEDPSKKNGISNSNNSSSSTTTTTVPVKAKCEKGSGRCHSELQSEGDRACSLKEVEKEEEYDALPSDDFSSIEYHMLDTPCHSKETTSSNQSDEDIEHIQHCELNRVRESSLRTCPEKCIDSSCHCESSPLVQRRKNSTISDDDLEYIHSSELCEITKSVEKSEDPCCAASSKRQSKQILSSDDDLEHVQHSDVSTATRNIDVVEPLKLSKTAEKKKHQQQQRKDIVVIESDTSEAEVTVIVAPLENRVTRSKTPDKEYSAELEEERVFERETASPARKSKTRVPKTSSGVSSTCATSSLIPSAKRSQTGGGGGEGESGGGGAGAGAGAEAGGTGGEANAIEIIDIDAMHKAELEASTQPAYFSRCRILFSRQKASVARSRKSRRGSRKPQGQETVEPFASSVVPSKLTMAELREAAEEWQETKVPSMEMSWSSIVKKNVLTSDGDTKKETDSLESLMEVEEQSENTDSKVALAIEQRPPAAEKLTEIEESAICTNVRKDDSSVRVESTSSKENSPEPMDREPEKRSDSDPDVLPERSSSSDELNGNVVEDDCSAVREVVERGGGTGNASSSAGAKKSTRSKKKKRR